VRKDGIGERSMEWEVVKRGALEEERDGRSFLTRN
jgi:hypothetical protein